MAGLHKFHQMGQQGSHLLGIMVVMESQTLTPNASLPGSKPGSALWSGTVSTSPTLLLPSPRDLVPSAPSLQVRT